MLLFCILMLMSCSLHLHNLYNAQIICFYFYTMLKIPNYASIGTEYVPKYAVLKFCDYASIKNRQYS